MDIRKPYCFGRQSLRFIDLLATACGQVAQGSGGTECESFMAGGPLRISEESRACSIDALTGFYPYTVGICLVFHFVLHGK